MCKYGRERYKERLPEWRSFIIRDNWQVLDVCRLSNIQIVFQNIVMLNESRLEKLRKIKLKVDFCASLGGRRPKGSVSYEHDIRLQQ